MKTKDWWLAFLRILIAPEDLKERLVWARRVHTGLWIGFFSIPFIGYILNWNIWQSHISWIQTAILVLFSILMINCFLVIILWKSWIRSMSLAIIRLEKEEAAKKDGPNIYQIGGRNVKKVA
jgi:hypothetical protein